MPELTHDEAVVNGVRLHYVESGDGPLVLLLHGFPEFWYSWREQIPALASAGYHVVAPDMRGYNASEKPHGVDAYRTDELIADVTGLIDHFGEESAHVVGHDWGGAVAWQVGIERPEPVDKLAVLNAPHPARFREGLRTPSQLKRSWYMFFFQLPWLPERFLSARGYESIENIFRDSAKNPEAFDEEDVRRYVEAAAQPGALTASINYYRALFRENVPAELRSLLGKERGSLDVTVPTMLIWGTEDFALDNELTEGMDRWIPDLRIERLSDASHWVQNDRPGRVNELLTEFLAE
ncbi:alpha/beta hydrolase [Haladaptatus sp. DYF46]|uniref:alpha/beta fold hydrolase n=1 Tax=Haladaptatus sp. DYF46 TaxID=2886041 RepID=UPI001E508609|nr:alpha/beta hydrolase [Haladaptatus sp. DYF46]